MQNSAFEKSMVEGEKEILATFGKKLVLKLKTGANNEITLIKSNSVDEKKHKGTQTIILTHYGELLVKAKYLGATYQHLTVAEVNHVTDTKTELVLSPAKRSNSETNKYGF